MKQVQLEMGGKNPFVVLDDADLKIAVECAVNGAFFSTGQRCTATSRLIVTAGIHDRFVDGLTDRLKKLVVDDALKPGTRNRPRGGRESARSGPALHRSARARARGCIGAASTQPREPGLLSAAALFTDATNQMRIAREEIFGPVAA